jgi:endonuclease YncB( thermonuclease family)
MDKRVLRLILTGAMLTAQLIVAPDANAESFTAKVLSVPDGDSLNVEHNGSKEKVILYGVDCPELGQAYGEEARKYTDERCWNKVLTFDDRGRDDKGRTIAVVYLTDGSNLNQALVEAGLAWWSDKYAPKETKLKELHAAAKAARKGLWADANPIPPWIFRNGERSVHATIKTN